MNFSFRIYIFQLQNFHLALSYNFCFLFQYPIISFIMNVLSFISLGTVTVTTLKASSAPFNISGISGLVFMRCLFCSYLLLLETGLRFLLSSRPIILDHSLDFVDVLLWSLWIEAHRFSSFSQAILPV